MSKYDSLAKQVSEDFRMTMLAMGNMRDSFALMSDSLAVMSESLAKVDEGLERVETGVRTTYRSIKKILAHQKVQDGRLDALESWQQEVNNKLSA